MLSICMIAKNEEAWIEGCLSHLQMLTPEIILVDTGSTDGTKEIAKSFGARVVATNWEDDFSKARNLSLSFATQPWIFSIDPDERIAARDLPKLLKLIEQKPHVKAFAFQTRNYVRKPTNDGQACDGQYLEERDYTHFFLSSKVRLFKNHLGIKFKGVVHETVSEDVIRVCRPGEFEESEIVLHHYGTDPVVTAQKNKRALYRRLTEKKVSEDPMNPEAQIEYGRECMSVGEHQKALQAFQRAVQLDPSSPYYRDELIRAYRRIQQ